MKARIVTTITTLMDLDTLTPEHSVDISDEDGLSEVSRDVLGALLIGALRATEKAVREQFPGADRSASRIDAAEADESGP